MRIFGTILPFLGFREYGLEVDEYFKNADPASDITEEIKFIIEQSGLDNPIIILKVFEFEWLGLLFGYNYRLAVRFY